MTIISHSYRKCSSQITNNHALLEIQSSTLLNIQIYNGEKISIPNISYGYFQARLSQTIQLANHPTIKKILF